MAKRKFWNVLTRQGLISGSPGWLKILWISAGAMGHSFLKNLHQWYCPGNSSLHRLAPKILEHFRVPLLWFIAIIISNNWALTAYLWMFKRGEVLRNKQPGLISKLNFNSFSKSLVEIIFHAAVKKIKKNSFVYLRTDRFSSWFCEESPVLTQKELTLCKFTGAQIQHFLIKYWHSNGIFCYIM